MDSTNRVVLPSNGNNEHTGERNVEFTGLPMKDIMSASFGEVASDLTVNYKKTVLIRDYETEVIEASTTIKVEGKLTGVERMFITALIEAQLEFTVYSNLFFKGLVTEAALKQRKKELEQEVFFIKTQADSILGTGKVDKYINDVGLDKV